MSYDFRHATPQGGAKSFDLRVQFVLARRGDLDAATEKIEKALGFTADTIGGNTSGGTMYFADLSLAQAKKLQRFEGKYGIVSVWLVKFKT